MKKQVVFLCILLVLVFGTTGIAFGIPIDFDISISGTLTGTNMGENDWGEVYGFIGLWNGIYEEERGCEEISGSGNHSIPINLSYSWSRDLPICHPVVLWWELAGQGYAETPGAEISWDVTGNLTITGPLEWLCREYGAAAEIEVEGDGFWYDGDEIWGSSEAEVNLVYDPTEVFGRAEMELLLNSRGHVAFTPESDWTYGWSAGGIYGEFHPTPEPSTLFLFGFSLLGAGLFKRRKAKK